LGDDQLRKENDMPLNLKRSLGGLVLVVMTMCTGVVYGAAAQDRANVAQVDRVDPWHCVAGIIGVDHEFTPIPGLSLALTTGGGPVQFTVNLSAQGSPLLGRLHVFLQPVVDGVAQSSDVL
jgi:hypothetical protein